MFGLVAQVADPTQDERQHILWTETKIERAFNEVKNLFNRSRAITFSQQRTCSIVKFKYR